jgi:hypothetical protein
VNRIWIVVAVMLAVLSAACGGDDDSTASDIAPEADSDATAGATDDGSAEPAAADGNEAGASVGDPPPPGMATASVDGLDLTFDVPNAVSPCSIADDSITFGFGVDGEEFTLAAGTIRVDGGWMGSIALDIANPDGEPGPIAYYPAPGENGVLDESLFAVDGSTMSYSGPMLKQPANDGSQPPPVEVGEGTIRATCE